MFFLYDLVVRLTAAFLHIPALFSQKIRLFLEGRQGVAAYLQDFRQTEQPLIWMHTASLGEFEQGLPVLERLRSEYPGHQFLVTFFSPSGYEVKKGKVPGAGTCYLPLDTRKNVREFLQLARPQIALFVKYEVWPNYFEGLASKGIPIVMFSARFRKKQVFFRWYGGFMRHALQHVAHFFVQDVQSRDLLSAIGLQQITVSGDTRLDRVLEIRERENHLGFMEGFAAGRTCLVAGSTWPEDEKVLLPLLRTLNGQTQCTVIAPHKTDEKTIASLMGLLGPGAVRYTEWERASPGRADILVLDTIGLLTRVYAYADLAYVGGGFATGLHNTLEPAVFGIPVLIGPRYHAFVEARGLVEAGGVLPVSGPEEFRQVAETLLRDSGERSRLGAINRAFVEKNAGASIRILDGIRKLIG
ncbi:3-deoxy-D-manno-octulosonic acid transferase [Robiginitalea sp. SC105]|uniref:3-deoxy-D-manno-octulosonic acid transferase n=1 Tax=Robiginitalea sp. SC105 TaxID=2762332 RepID=UPI0016394F51|nr:glycosyltransferase N-terminal domain-containing protein [Robiginitalea sp. SC105]MBC2838711.1 3-deoxy-D-manno-octulosonic acid transferase [Robiginitalea sp. SC105]